MPSEQAQFLAGGRVAELHGPLVGSQRQHPAVGGKGGGQGQRTRLRPPKIAEFLIRGEVPDADYSSPVAGTALASLVDACRGQRLAVGEEEHGRNQGRGRLPGKRLAR